MPALAGLLILIGARTIKPADLQSVWRTGPVQKVVLAATFALTMVIPLQYAVLLGVAVSMVLHTVRQSNQISIKRRTFDDAGHMTETDPPAQLPANDVVILQPYGSLFFAAAPVFEAALPEITQPHATPSSSSGSAGGATSGRRSWMSSAATPKRSAPTAASWSSCPSKTGSSNSSPSPE